MSHTGFSTYYKSPTKLETNALNIAEQLFCHPRYTQDYPTPCTRHPHPRTLKPQFITHNHTLLPRIQTTPTNTPRPQQTHMPNPPINTINNPLRFPIHTILNHKANETKDKYKLTIKHNTYLCQWILQNNITYHKWLPQRTLFPLNQPLVIEHNLKLLNEYYTKYQHDYYKNIVNTHFTPAQLRDTRFIPPSTKLPHTQISIIECNPEEDIATTQNTIQTQNELTHLYDDTCKYLITIPTPRLEWLWKQYHNSNHNTHGLIPPHNHLKQKSYGSI